MTRFCLVRHGQTDWNLEGRYQGQSEVPLNARGQEQARLVAEKLKGQSFAAIYSSDLGRAKETAEFIADVLQIPVQVDTRLREINQGEWEGKLVTFIQQHYAGLWQQRSTDPASARPPGGETVAEVAERVSQALDEIAAKYPHASVLISSHGLSLATIICMAKGIPVGHAYEHIPENAEPIWVEWNNSSV